MKRHEIEEHCVPVTTMDRFYIIIHYSKKKDNMFKILQVTELIKYEHEGLFTEGTTRSTS